MSGNLTRRAFFRASGAAAIGLAASSARAWDLRDMIVAPPGPEKQLPPKASVDVVGSMAPNLSRPAPVNLVLCMDVSGSMTAGGGPNLDIQVEGTARALASDNVGRVIERKGGIGITCVSFDTSARQEVGWAFLKDRADAARYADMIRAMPRMGRGGTQISSGLLLAATMFSGAPFKADSRVVDVSGDGHEDAGVFMLKASTGMLAEKFAARVNGLAICDKEPKLDAYFKDYLVTDMAMFERHEAPLGRVWKVSDMKDYEQVMMMKLMDEIAQAGPKTKGLTL